MMTLLVAGTLLGLQNGSATVIVDDKPLAMSGIITPQNRVIVPLRAVSEALGATVQYLAPNNKVVISTLRKEVSLILGEKIAYDLDNKPIDSPARLVEGRVYVPLRFVSESLGAGVRWDREARTAYVISGEPG